MSTSSTFNLGLVNNRLGVLSDQIADLGPINNLTSDSTVAALSAAQGKAINTILDSLKSIVSYGSISTTEDANDSKFRITGVHVYTGSYSLNRLNFPSDYTGGVFVTFGAEGMSWQFACDYDLTNLWFRTFYQNWKAWKQL